MMVSRRPGENTVASRKAKGLLREILLPWQVRWVEDASRFKIGLWSRQSGKSFSTACEAVMGCQTVRGAHWVVLSAGERQALEWMEKAKQWAEAVDAVVASYSELREGGAETLVKRAEIRFGNGSRITAIPANPATARGYSANLVLDEFAIHEKPYDIWAAIYPSITNDLRGEKVLRVVSTPKGRGNMFADIWEANPRFSKHKETIEDAVREGLYGPDPEKARAKLAELRYGVGDADIWAQEFMCEFLDNSSVLLPYELIGKCESGSIQDDGHGMLYIGMDIGRRKDLTVIVTAAMQGDVLAVTDVTELSRMPFADQLDVLVGKARQTRVARVCIDATGLGAMLAEEARRKIGGKAVPVVFTPASKGEMFGLMRRRFEERSVRIPVSRELREDLHAVQRVVSTGGKVTYSAPRNEDGHSDRASALALCCMAAQQAGGFFVPRTFDTGRGGIRGWLRKRLIG